MNRRKLFLCTASVAIGLAVLVVAAVRSPANAPAGSVMAAAPMLQPRSGHSATLLPDGRVLIAGGMRRNQDFYRSAELYDPATGKFRSTGEMTLARVGQAAVLLRSGKVLIVGGWVGHGCTDSAELYDPATGVFTAIAKMTTRRGRPEATLLGNGDVLITGGGDHDEPGGVATAELYRADKQTFERLPPMHVARIAHTATLMKDGRVLIAGGRGDNVTAAAEIYDPSARTFSPTGSMHDARYKHTAGLLADGKILIVGGSDERDWRGSMASAELYDPNTGRFTTTDSLHQSRFKLPSEAVQLRSGNLLIAGGGNQVEVYDPSSMKFNAASGTLGNDWHFMSETRLQNGTVLLAGGYADDDRGTAQTWLYQPRR